MKNKIGYIISIVLSLLIGALIAVFTLDYLNDNNNENQKITTTLKEVNITESNTLTSSLEKIYDSVVVIQSYGNNSKLISTGTGFFYKKDSKNGYIITNQHVIQKVKTIKVTNIEGLEVEAKVLGNDEYSDIAVLSVPTSSVLQVAKIGDSSKTSIGDTVFTVGSPLGIKYMGTVTKGILSGKNRQVTVKLSNGSFVMDVMQTDAAINPGNSGGPLLNINGEVIGITSLKLVQDEIEGMGFALPIESVMNSINKLENGVSVDRPIFGVQLIDLDSESILDSYNINIDKTITKGAVIVKVEDDTPAKKANLKKGDVIIKINNDTINDTAHFRYCLYKYSINDTIKITYLRNNKEYNINVKLTEKLKN